MAHWSLDSFFYHVYPLALCGAPQNNDFTSAPVPRLEKLHGWLDHLQELGVNAIYLGPLFESGTHGYDTSDYYHVDRRLGDRNTLARLSDHIHNRGMRLILDGVFNHVGRHFWAFRDVQERLTNSPYGEWFHGLRFDQRSPYGDPFTYSTWNGHASLVKLNLGHPPVCQHLFDAVTMWVNEFDIDGLRLDAADCLDLDFQKALANHCRGLKPDFWLLGEIIHGDYRIWANPETLDSVTNYEAYKGLYSSLNDHNYFEIAHTLNRQFGEGGLYRGLPLYAFADNHDVDRVASRLANPAHLYPLYTLLFSMPGVPSLYYGSEWGITGKRTAHDDSPLRPQLDLIQAARTGPHLELAGVIARLAAIRQASPVLRYGDYHPLHVSAEQFAFRRTSNGESVLVVLNAADQPVDLELSVPLQENRLMADALNPGETFTVRQGKLSLTVAPCWGRILA